jgi:hypothetical protein
VPDHDYTRAQLRFDERARRDALGDAVVGAGSSAAAIAGEQLTERPLVVEVRMPLSTATRNAFQVRACVARMCACVFVAS